MVTGEAPMLQTDRTDTGRIIESEQITQMPLGFNRNFQALLITVPGASRPFRPHSEFYNSQDSLSSNVNGQSRQVNNVQLEGADNSDNGGNWRFIFRRPRRSRPSSVTTSNYDAEFGRAGGAVTNVTMNRERTRSGAQCSAFGNTEATSRVTRSRRCRRGHQVRAGRLHVGGPIKRNKLFFFGDYVRTNDDSGRLTQGHVPEPAFRNGDFSAAPTRHLRSGNRAMPTAAGGRHFANNQIPANRISPIAQRLIAKSRCRISPARPWRDQLREDRT